LASIGIALSALGPQSYKSLQSPFTQELFGATGNLLDPDFGILGGVAFAPDGDVWSSECLFDHTRLHRFDLQATATAHNTTVHPETIVQTEGGCGIVNHPDGTMYSNSSQGIWNLNANTGLPVSGLPHGPGGNALGIAVDPKPGAGSHIVYVGADCHPALTPDSSTCTFYDLDPVTNVAMVFARFSTSRIAMVDGIYFDPTGNFLFVAERDPGHALGVIARPSALKPLNTGVDDSQILQEQAMISEPDGVAFHATDGFVVTLNESDDGPGLDGTITRFNFAGGDFSQAAVQSTFASGGFRGDLLQVGADGCIYATQGLFDSRLGFGTRYDDGTETVENSIVRICGGFVPPPGVVHPPSGRIGDFVWLDLNSDGVQDAGEPGIDGVQLTLRNSGGTAIATAVTSGGAYVFEQLPAGNYTVEVSAPPAGLAPTPSGAGADRGLDSNGSPASVTLATDASEDLLVDFGYVPPPPPCNGMIGDFVWRDQNQNGIQDAGEPGIPNAEVLLTTSSGALSATTDVNGAYLFSNLCAGNYQVSVNLSTVPDGLIPTLTGVGSNRAVDSNPPQSPVTLATGSASDLSIDFGFVSDQNPQQNGKTFTIGPSTMEGNLSKINPGDWVSGGYSFKFVSGVHAATTFMVTAQVDIEVTCPIGGGPGGTITIPLGTKSYSVPANNTAWLPTGDANNVLSWQGSIQAPNLCGGNRMDDIHGAVYTATVSQNPPSGSLVDFRFKYRDPAAKGKPNTNCLDVSDPNRAKADVCGASWSATRRDP